MDLSLNIAGSDPKLSISSLPHFYGARRPEHLDFERLVWDMEYRERTRPLWRSQIRSENCAEP